MQYFQQWQRTLREDEELLPIDKTSVLVPIYRDTMFEEGCEKSNSSSSISASSSSTKLKLRRHLRSGGHKRIDKKGDLIVVKHDTNKKNVSGASRRNAAEKEEGVLMGHDCVESRDDASNEERDTEYGPNQFRNSARVDTTSDLEILYTKVEEIRLKDGDDGDTVLEVRNIKVTSTCSWGDLESDCSSLSLDQSIFSSSQSISSESSSQSVVTSPSEISAPSGSLQSTPPRHDIDQECESFGSCDKYDGYDEHESVELQHSESCVDDGIDVLIMNNSYTSNEGQIRRDTCVQKYYTSGEETDQLGHRLYTTWLDSKQNQRWSDVGMLRHSESEAESEATLTYSVSSCPARLSMSKALTDFAAFSLGESFSDDSDLERNNSGNTTLSIGSDIQEEIENNDKENSVLNSFIPTKYRSIIDRITNCASDVEYEVIPFGDSNLEEKLMIEKYSHNECEPSTVTSISDESATLPSVLTPSGSCDILSSGMSNRLLSSSDSSEDSDFSSTIGHSISCSSHSSVGLDDIQPTISSLSNKSSICGVMTV